MDSVCHWIHNGVLSTDSSSTHFILKHFYFHNTHIILQLITAMRAKSSDNERILSSKRRLNDTNCLQDCDFAVPQEPTAATVKF